MNVAVLKFLKQAATVYKPVIKVFNAEDSRGVPPSPFCVIFSCNNHDLCKKFTPSKYTSHLEHMQDSYYHLLYIAKFSNSLTTYTLFDFFFMKFVINYHHVPALKLHLYFDSKVPGVKGLHIYLLWTLRRRFTKYGTFYFMVPIYPTNTNT